MRSLGSNESNEEVRQAVSMESDQRGRPYEGEYCDPARMIPLKELSLLILQQEWKEVPREIGHNVPQ